MIEVSYRCHFGALTLLRNCCCQYLCPNSRESHWDWIQAQSKVLLVRFSICIWKASNNLTVWGQTTAEEIDVEVSDIDDEDGNDLIGECLQTRDGICFAWPTAWNAANIVSFFSLAFAAACSWFHISLFLLHWALPVCFLAKKLVPAETTLTLVWQSGQVTLLSSS